MKRERRQSTCAELASITSSRLVVVRKIRPEKPKSSETSLSEVTTNDEKGARRMIEETEERNDRDRKTDAEGVADAENHRQLSEEHDARARLLRETTP